MLQTIEADILEIRQGIICHFCNTEGVMGAGLAAQVKHKYPKAFQAYSQDSRKLGTITLVDVAPYKYICNMVTQDLKGRGTQYKAVLDAFSDLESEDIVYYRNIVTSHDSPAIKLYFPEFVGFLS
jgi:O-acetyl-ADP-ribose deacetylase (regulator of RNase III)